MADIFSQSYIYDATPGSITFILGIDFFDAPLPIGGTLELEQYGVTIKALPSIFMLGTRVTQVEVMLT